MYTILILRNLFIGPPMHTRQDSHTTALVGMVGAFAAEGGMGEEAKYSGIPREFP